MALADPISITHGGTTYVLPKTGGQGTIGIYGTNDQPIKLTVSHQYGAKQIRSLFRLDFVKVVTDPLNPTLYSEEQESFQWIWIHPKKKAFNTADGVSLLTAGNASLSASTNALATKFLNGEF